MNSKEVKDLMEAYASIYDQQESSDLEEGMGLSVGTSKLAGKLFSNPRTSAEEGAKNFQKNIADPVGHAVKGAARAVLGVGDKKNEAMKQKRRPAQEEIDLSDVIQGHLISEGYATNEEAALVIMQNMSDTWVNSIEEQMSDCYYDIVEEYLISEGATQEESQYIMAYMTEDLIDEGILGAALKVASNLVKSGGAAKVAKVAKKLPGGDKVVKALSSAMKGSGAGKNALGKLGSGNITTKGMDLTPKGGRAAELAKRLRVGPERSDTSAKMKIIQRARAQVKAAEKQFDMGNASQRYVDDAKAALDKYLKAGYSKYGASSPNTYGRGSKAAKRARQLADK